MMNDFRIGAWLIRPALNRVTGPDGTISVEPRLMRILTLLAEQPGTVVERNVLLEAVWPDTVVTDNSLTNSISDLRKLFGDDPQSPRVIETIRGVGYRLVAPVADPVPPGIAPATSPWKRYALILPLLVILTGIGFVVFQDRSPEPMQRILPLTGSLPGVELHPTFSPDGRNLAFVWFNEPGRPADIYVQQLEGETPVRLTKRAGAELAPAWSPDGTRIAFFANNGTTCGLFLVPSGGGPPRKLIDSACGVRSLTWSPDGNWLAFARPGDDGASASYIGLLSLNTRAFYPLTHPEPHLPGDQAPRFSPDGRTLAFLRATGSTTNDLYLLSLPPDPAGPPRIPRRLTHDDATITGFDWTPDGREVVFGSNRAETRALWRLPVEGGLPILVRAISVDDPGSVAISRQGAHLAYIDWTYEINIWRAPGPHGSPSTPAPLITSTRADQEPHYAPSGDRIAFTSSRSGVNEIWVSDRDGQNPMRLTTLNRPSTRAPRFSPDGRWVAFESRTEGQSEVYVIDADGGSSQRITTASAHDVQPAWSADGTALFFASDRTGQWEIWKRSLDDGEARQVTRNGGLTAQTAPDGSTLYFVKPDTTGIWALSLETGSERLLLQADRKNWTVTRNALYYVTQSTPVSNVVVHRLDFKTSRVDSVATLPINMVSTFGRWGLSVSPDEHWILYGLNDRAESDIMLLEHFL